MQARGSIPESYISRSAPEFRCNEWSTECPPNSLCAKDTPPVSGYMVLTSDVRLCARCRSRNATKCFGRRWNIGGGGFRKALIMDAGAKQCNGPRWLLNYSRTDPPAPLLARRRALLPKALKADATGTAATVRVATLRFR